MIQKGMGTFIIGAWLVSLFFIPPSFAQLIDNTQTLNPINAGINKSLIQEIGAGHGDVMTPDSSVFIIKRDPFRGIRRGRQLFNRKFTQAQGQGPRLFDGTGDIVRYPGLGAGLGDSCANCHGRPRGSAGFGGDVVTRPDSRDAPHLFGLGLREMLADEITADLRAIRADAVAMAQSSKKPVKRELVSKGISYGFITAAANGSIDTSQVVGVNPDLRVRPFFAHGGTISIREFLIGAAKNEMGIEAVDPDLYATSKGGVFTTPAGMVYDGSIDRIEAPPTSNPKADPDGDGVKNEMPESLVDFMEFYLLNYFAPTKYEQTQKTENGRSIFMALGCGKCHIPDLQIDRDRRVANVETAFDPINGIFNNLFATATTTFITQNDGSGYPPLKLPALNTFVVKDIFTDFKRHDLGPYFYERNYDGTFQEVWMTRPLWGVGSSSPYGHDGRSINLTEVILRHAGEAQSASDAFARLSETQESYLLAFLNALVLFPPDDTASNLDPGNRGALGFPQIGHGSIKLTVLFNNPSDLE